MSMENMKVFMQNLERLDNIIGHPVHTSAHEIKIFMQYASVFLRDIS